MKCQVLIEEKYSFVKGQISKFRPTIVLNVFLLAIDRGVKTFGITIVDFDIEIFLRSSSYVPFCLFLVLPRVAADPQVPPVVGKERTRSPEKRYSQSYLQFRN